MLKKFSQYVTDNRSRRVVPNCKSKPLIFHQSMTTISPLTIFVLNQLIRIPILERGSTMAWRLIIRNYCVFNKQLNSKYKNRRWQDNKISQPIVFYSFKLSSDRGFWFVCAAQKARLLIRQIWLPLVRYENHNNRWRIVHF